MESMTRSELQSPNSHSHRCGLIMHRPPSNLIISTVFPNTNKWSAPRPPTLLSAFFSQATVSFDIANIPAVPALSFFDPDTPSTIALTLRSPFPLSQTHRFSYNSRPCAVASTMSPSIYSPLLSPDWMISPTLQSPLILSPSLTQFSSLSPCESDLHRIDGFSSSSSATSTCPTAASSPLLSPALEDAYKAYFLGTDSQMPLYSPLLSPHYMFPRIPPCPPLLPSAVSSSPSSSTALSSVPPQARKSHNQRKNSLSRLRMSEVSIHAEAVGWSDMDSPVRLHFNGCSPEPRPTIQERRLKAISSVTSLKSVDSIKKATSKERGWKSMRSASSLRGWSPIVEDSRSMVENAKESM